MADFADAFLPALDQLRGIAGILGFRGTKVTVRVVSWTGARQGLGIQSYIDTVLTVASNNPQNPRVTQVNARDALASGGLYTNQDLKVGPFSPPFLATALIKAGGIGHDIINPLQPTAGSSYKEIHFKVEGKGFQFPVWFERIEDEAIPTLHRFLFLRRSGNQQPGGVP